jgi:hypothetical protein
MNTNKKERKAKKEEIMDSGQGKVQEKSQL